MNYLISITMGYLLGSIPTAYLLLKNSRGIDIRQTGSGNVGAYNSFDVSNSKLIGLTVLLIDAGKGALSAYLAILVYGDVFIYPAVAGIFAIFAHCYNPWLGFSGGRGLATFAGVSIIIFPYLLIVWIVLWTIFYIIKRDIHFANIGATVMSLILIFNSLDIAIKYANPKPGSASTLILFTMTGLIIIFIKHIEPLKELIKDQKIIRMNRNEKN
ncbi:glycerol-3-phosphate acyltransferase [bacterium BMS3Abin03]|nr:glycerol-3-phosphate acyltransferase [bacterium BMS3Abin03]